MITFRVPEIMCGGCVARIEKGLQEAGVDASVSLQDKTVTVNGCEKCAAKAVGVLEDLGFSAEKLF